jgi:2-keto-3-deoxy-L-rhamnonate aldolase RhmA
MTNRLKQVWVSGKAAVNGWLAIPSGFSAEVMAQCGFDSITVDLQHGVQDYLSMVACFQAMQAHPSDAGSPRAVERDRHRQQGSRRGCVRRDLSDGEHARAGRGVRRCL